MESHASTEVSYVFIVRDFEARSENKVLKEKVERLEARCRVLTVENETLKAEVEMYRTEFATTTANKSGSAAKSGDRQQQEQKVGDNDDVFVTSGDGNYAKSNDVSLLNLHDNANISCCSLSSDDTILATGGADRNLSLLQWGVALDQDEESTEDIIKQNAVRVFCGAPVIAVDFSRKPRSNFVAAGCMDGSCHIIHYETHGKLEAKEVCVGTIKHSKYVKAVSWLSEDNIIASSAADGTVQIHKVIWNGLDDNFQLQKLKSLNLSGPIESLCFHNGYLICYARDTPYLSYFQLAKDYEHTKINLNQDETGSAGFDEHVSFAIMDIKPFGDYLALATDTSRNIIVELSTGKQLRNLYGHQNDGYSQPKVCWSSNGKYLFGNTQDEPVICVWDVASAEIVERLAGHTQPIRDLSSSLTTDTMVSSSFDKKTFVWLAPST